MDNQNTLISYITLGVSDLNKMQTFYSELGFTLHAQSDHQDHPYAMFKSGGLILALYPKHLLAKQSACCIEDTSINHSMSLSLNVISKEHVDNIIDKAKQLNAKVTRKGFEPAWGGYCAYFKDPESNLWEIVWNEKFRFGE